MYNPSPNCTSVEVTVPVAGLQPGTYYIQIYANVTAQGPDGTPKVSGTNGYFRFVKEVCVLHPGIDVEKSGPTYAHEGDTITYTITVKNTGDCQLSKVSVEDSLLGFSWTGTLDVGEKESWNVTYEVPSSSENITNTVKAEGEDASGLKVSDTAKWTVRILRFGKICGFKFYDANCNGEWDDGEPAVEGFKIELYNGEGNLVDTEFTNESGMYCFDELEAGKYIVKEVLPSGWINTTLAELTVTIETGEVSEDNNFGNVCLKPGYGGKTLGFWTNKNGQALITASDVSALNRLNLYRPNEWAYPPFSSVLTTAKAQIREYLLKANAKDMRWMLSAQLIATTLNVRHGFLSNSTIVYVGPSLYVPTGFITISNILENANKALLGTDRAAQAYWKDLLDGLNNNRLPFVCSEPCYPIVYPQGDP